MSALDGWRTEWFNEILRTATFPVEDVVYHEKFSKNCVCGPKVVPLDYGWIQLIHNSLDGRELSEP
jgi:hypothetical protein